LLGSDSPQIFNVPGFSTHRELDALVAAGLTPFEALRTGTAAVAEFLGSKTGVVAVGRNADLVLLDASNDGSSPSARPCEPLLIC
jgi:imidazolonepropionase-like amidohydrolase